MRSSIGKHPFWRGKIFRVFFVFLVCPVLLSRTRAATEIEVRRINCNILEINKFNEGNLDRIHKNYLANWFKDIVNPNERSVLMTIPIGPKGRQGRTQMSVNELKKMELETGTLKTMDFIKHRIKQGETSWSLARRYGVTLAQLEKNNPGLNLRMIKSGDWIIIKTGAGSRKATRARELPTTSILNAPGERTLLVPVVGCLTSPYGRRGSGMHWGIDLAAAAGTPVKAAAAGTVEYAGWASGYGLLVIMDHGKFRTFYAHNSRLRVIQGEWITAGEVIAEVGQTGRATGNHLHFEVEVKGIKINPLPYLKK